MIMTIKSIIASLMLVGVVSVRADNRKFSLEADAPAFWNLFDRNAQLTKLASGFGFTEGPVWDEAG